MLYEEKKNLTVQNRTQNNFGPPEEEEEDMS